MVGIDSWHYSLEHRQPCRVIESDSLWGEEMCRVWLPNRDVIIRLPASRIVPLSDSPVASTDSVVYAAAAARIADALAQDVLIAPIGSSVIPLPHQIHALSRAIRADRVRYLLADEVGLGKTIEAGLIMRELKLRGHVQRTLVIAPKGLVAQWASEMMVHFGEDFRVLAPSEFRAYRRISQESNLWRSHPQIICSMDSVKPLDGRRGWSREQVAEYNRERYEDLVAAGWDLVIVDEAHRLAGSTDQVARHRLGEGLSTTTPYVLLLSATPHQGKSDAFRRLLSLLDHDAFPGIESITPERVRPYVIRTEKRRAIDAEGRPLFKPRRTQLASVPWGPQHQAQRLLYDAVTEYVREGYNQALLDKRAYVGFLMILMQRLVVSSTRAIRASLERRLAAIEGPEEQLSLFSEMASEDWAELDGQQQMELLLTARLRALRSEAEEVRALLSAARSCEAAADAKAEALLHWLYRLQQEEGDPDLKVLIFTEFVPTQRMLEQFLSDRGFSVVCLNGTMNLHERQKAQETFAEEARVMVSTEAGGEGLNLQFCHVVINYDIPWNPMRLEQRIGRVDRIGQRHTVRAINLVLEDSVEHRVLEVLEQKLAVILAELGVDKASDVLDSAEAEGVFEELYVAALQHPESVETIVDSALDRIREEMTATRQSSAVLGTSEFTPADAQKVAEHPLPHWVQQMTISYLKANAGEATRRGNAWDLTWPTGDRIEGAVFLSKEASGQAAGTMITLEDARVRGLVTRLPRFVPGQPVPRVTLPDLTPDITGFWALWRVSLRAGEWNRLRAVPVFLHDDGRSLAPTAHHIWDQLVMHSPRALGVAGEPEVRSVLPQMQALAQSLCKGPYEELVELHRERLEREREKSQHLQDVRRSAIERIGLPAVRSHRLLELEQDERQWRARRQEEERVMPELVPVIVLRIDREHSNG